MASALRKALRIPNLYRTHIQQKGVVEGVKYGTVGVGSHGYRAAFGEPGTPVWERDWDVLLVLDACRVDLMREVLDEYAFLPERGELESLYSVASMSNDWLERTFAAEHAEDAAETAYVTGNAFTEKVDLEAQPALVDEVWKTDWNDDLNTIEARPITERAVHAWREAQPDRMIVHYMQPHVPFVERPDLGTYTTPEEFGEGFADVWSRVGDSLDPDDVWDAYRDNLRYVLDDVAVLLENLDADTVAISADHGNAVGEWGTYGHPSDILLPCIRRVPWTETTATDEHTLDGRAPPQDEAVDADAVEDRLRALGYR